MEMTNEQKEIDNTFNTFLSDIDKEYSDYFASDDIVETSIRSCFGIWNGSHLKVMGSRLRQDIFDKVVNKHKELWGNLHSLDFLKS